jgi:hypothetical protein
MLQHLRSIALKSFKTKLEKTVKERRGDGFEAFVDSCGQSIMLQFKKGCEGKKKILSVFFCFFYYLKTWDSFIYIYPAFYQMQL